MHALSIVDDIDLSYMTNINDIDYQPERAQWLRSNFFYFSSFKNLADTKNQEDE